MRMTREAREFVADWLTVVAAVLLLVSLFLTWSHQFSPGFLAEFQASVALQGVPHDPTAWQVYSVADVGLALLALALFAVALAGRRWSRVVLLSLLAVALVFTIHALNVPPTNGASIASPAAGASGYVANHPSAGPGEVLALVALGTGIAGLALSLTVD
jgi:hypothetical protein